MTVDMARKILLVCKIILVYGLIWMALEFFIYGEIQGRIVDDIMMLLFVPIIWKAIDNHFKE